MIRNRGAIARNSAGPRDTKRVLDREEVLGRREIVTRQPPSPERSAALTKIRHQLISIDRRATHG
jgi:hypothetical protein